MFVRQSTYDAKCVESRANLGLARLYIDKHSALQRKWNDLVDKVNAIGGESAFDNKQASSQFNQEEISRLILLCHPDKHDGKTMATEMTQKLLKMRT